MSRAWAPWWRRCRWRSEAGWWPARSSDTPSASPSAVCTRAAGRSGRSTRSSSPWDGRLLLRHRDRTRERVRHPGRGRGDPANRPTRRRGAARHHAAATGGVGEVVLFASLGAMLDLSSARSPDSDARDPGAVRGRPGRRAWRPPGSARFERTCGCASASTSAWHRSPRPPCRPSSAPVILATLSGQAVGLPAEGQTLLLMAVLGILATAPVGAVVLDRWGSGCCRRKPRALGASVLLQKFGCIRSALWRPACVALARRSFGYASLATPWQAARGPISLHTELRRAPSRLLRRTSGAGH